MASILRHLISRSKLTSLSINSHPSRIRRCVLSPLLDPQNSCFECVFRSITSIQDFDNILSDAEERLGFRRRITREHGDALLHAIRAKPSIQPEQSIIALQCFGEMMPEEQPAERTKLVETLWSTLKDLNIKLEINHYNVLLKLHLDNENTIEPNEILEEINERGLVLNRHTYELLAKHYARKGDIQSILRLIEEVTTQFGRPFVQMYNVLIGAYCENGDLEKAEAVLAKMLESGINSNVETHVEFLCVHAKRGDISTIISEIERLALAEFHLHHLDVLRIIETFVSHGHPPYITMLFRSDEQGVEFNDDATNFILRMLNKGRSDIAFGILDKMHKTVSINGHFILRQVVRLNLPLPDVIDICTQLNSTGLIPCAYFALLKSIREVRSSPEDILTTLRELRARSIALNAAHFDSLFKCTAPSEIIETVRIMTDEFGIIPSMEFTRKAIVQPLDLGNVEQLVYDLRDANIPLYAAAQSVVFHCIHRNQLNDAANVMNQFQQRIHPQLYQDFLIKALHETGDFENYVRIARNMYENYAILEAENGNAAAGAADMAGSLAYKTIVAFNSEAFVDTFNRIAQCFLEHGINISQHQALRIASLLQSTDPALNMADITELLNRLVTAQLIPAPVERIQRSTQMTTIEYEAIVKKLGNQTPLKLVANLLKRYHAERNCIKFEELLNQFTAFNFNITMETYTQLIDLQIDAKQPLKALESYTNARRQYSSPSFCLRRDFSLKLVAQLIECDRTVEAIQFLEDNKGTAKLGHRGRYKAYTLFQLLHHYQSQNATEKVLMLWRRLSEINSIPNPKFTRQASNWLKEMNVDVPFAIPVSEKKR